jgi:tRNA(Ile)-lysidine synthase
VCQIADIKDIKNINKNKLFETFDYDKINENLVLRTRKNGDIITPSGMNGTKKLKDFFIDNKIPQNVRDKTPLIADEKEIIWIIGYRKSEKYKITKETRKVLVISYEIQ